MSNLKKILIFMFCFQLALQVVNNIEIVPGVYLNTGEISPYTSWYDPLTDMVTSLNSTNTALHPTVTESGDQTAVFVIQRILFINTNIIWTVNISSGSTDFLGFPVPDLIFDLPLLILSALLEAAVLLFTLIFSVLGLLFMLIVNTTIGAIPMYIFLFSLIDPTLGTILGICIGAIQSLYIVWGLTSLIPQTNKQEL